MSSTMSCSWLMTNCRYARSEWSNVIYSIPTCREPWTPYAFSHLTSDRARKTIDAPGTWAHAARTLRGALCRVRTGAVPMTGLVAPQRLRVQLWSTTTGQRGARQVEE